MLQTIKRSELDQHNNKRSEKNDERKKKNIN